MIRHIKRHRRAFTLAELTVVIALFGIFATTALATLNLTMRHWSRVSDQVELNAMCRMVISTISRELRQSTPDQYPPRASYYLYSDGTSSGDATAVITPNQQGVTSNILSFTEVDVKNFDPVAATWDAKASNVYRTVTYKVNDKKQLIREVLSYDGTGDHTEAAITAAADEADLQVKCLGPAQYRVSITCKRYSGTIVHSAHLETTVYIIGK